MVTRLRLTTAIKPEQTFTSYVVAVDFLEQQQALKSSLWRHHSRLVRALAELGFPNYCLTGEQYRCEWIYGGELTRP